MIDGARESAPLEAVLAKIKRREASLWGKAQRRTHEWLARLEKSSFLIRFDRTFRPPATLPSLRAEPAIDLDSLFLVSLLFHLLLLFLLALITSRSAPPLKPAPIVVRLLELPGPSPEKTQQPKKKAETKTRPPKKPAKPAPKPPPALPAPKELAQLALPDTEMSPSSRLAESLVQLPTKASEPPPVQPAPKPAPSLPTPKELAQVPPPTREMSFSSRPAESLVQLPTRSPGTEPASVATAIEPLPESLARAKELSSEPSAQGAPAAFSNPDFSAYLQMIKKRVEASWKYPEGISGKQVINILFVIDKGGKLVRAEVLDSTDPRLKNSALAAIKQASPFPPIPASLAKELAGWPLRLQFSIDFGVKLSQ